MDKYLAGSSSWSEEALEVTIHKKILDHYHRVSLEHDRFLSWEYCYSYFRRVTPRGISGDRNQAALQLAFYLASWGMYRASSFLFKHAFTVHLGVIDVLSEPRFSVLWQTEFGTSETDDEVMPVISEAIKGIRTAYLSFGEPTDTLVTKVILGTFGCLPACDQYFIKGFRQSGFRYSRVNENFIKRALQFCQYNSGELKKAQVAIEKIGGTHYPLMKLVDMYFWQIGFDKSRRVVRN